MSSNRNKKWANNPDSLNILILFPLKAPAIESCNAVHAKNLKLKEFEQKISILEPLCKSIWYKIPWQLILQKKKHIIFQVILNTHIRKKYWPVLHTPAGGSVFLKLIINSTCTITQRQEQCCWGSSCSDAARLIEQHIGCKSTNMRASCRGGSLVLFFSLPAAFTMHSRGTLCRTICLLTPPRFEKTCSPSQTRGLMIYTCNVCALNYIFCIDHGHADVSVGESLVKNKA